MKIINNSRGNGACPLCESSGNCQVQDTIIEATDDFSSESDSMELVVHARSFRRRHRK